MKNKYTLFLLIFCSLFLLAVASPKQSPQNYLQTIASANTHTYKTNEKQHFENSNLIKNIENHKLSWKNKLLVKLLLMKFSNKVNTISKTKGSEFSILGFMMGLFLGVSGLIVAALIDSIGLKNGQKLFKSALYGFLTLLAIGFIIIILLFMALIR
jgi:hypothetical protein